MLAAFEQTEEDWMRWRHRTVTLRTATQMVADGLAISLTRKHRGVELTLYRESQPQRVSLPTPCTLTRATMEAAAANQPGNRHARLSPSERMHVEKLQMWPFVDFKLVNGEFVPATFKAVTIRPRASAQEVKNAKALLLQDVAKASAPVKKPRTQAVHYSEMPAAA